MSNSYVLRLHAEDSKIQEINDYLSDHCNWLRGFETGKETEKPHFHYVLFDLTCTAQNLRNAIRATGVTGNGGYSLKKSKDDLLSVAYSIKEGSVDFSTGFDRTSSLYLNALDYNKNFKADLKAKKSSSQWKEIQEAVEEKLKTYPKLLWPLKTLYGDIWYPDLAHFILDFYKAKNAPIRSNTIKYLYESLLVYNLKDYEKDFLENIFLHK
jgi:hypothetical protein